MRRVDSEPELDSAFRDASERGRTLLPRPADVCRKVIQRPRHIEIQLIGDMHGNLVHLGERECSIQRRHQKVMEECPSPLVALDLRHARSDGRSRHSRRAGRRILQRRDGRVPVDHDRTVLLPGDEHRLQVEHPVTEWVTGLDLVRLQLEVAAGNTLPFAQEQVAWRGSAIECRIYAEDPDNNFYPSPGRITRLTRPLGPGIRIDGCIYSGWTVPWITIRCWRRWRFGRHPQDAIARSIRALREYDVAGIKTNIGFFRQILDDQDFVRGDLHTGFIDEFFARKRPRRPRDTEQLRHWSRAFTTPRAPLRRQRLGSGNRLADFGTRQHAAMKVPVTVNGVEHVVEFEEAARRAALDRLRTGALSRRRGSGAFGLLRDLRGTYL